MIMLRYANKEVANLIAVANISEEIREARLRWLGHVERESQRKM